MSWVLLAGVLALFTTLLICVELVLRRWSRGERGDRRVGRLRPAYKLDFEELRRRSGNEPFDYLTPEFYATLKVLMRRWSADGSTVPDDELDAHLAEYRQRGIETFDRNRDHHEPGHNVESGMRSLGHQSPVVSGTRRVHLLGGSTVYNEECPDEITLAALLSRSLNDASAPSHYHVLNRGVKGARIAERIDFLLRHQTVQPGDIVVCYFGANDSGWVAPTGLGWESQLPLPWRICRRCMRHVQLEILNWIYEEKLDRMMGHAIRVSCEATLESLERLREHVRRVGARCLFVLQPTAFVSRPSRPDVESVVDGTPPRFREFIRSSYRTYRRDCSQSGDFVDLSGVLDQTESRVYLDWAHLNARGNRVVAQAIALRLASDLAIISFDRR